MNEFTLSSESIAQLAAALAKAQAVMKPAAKDATNPHFNSRYADLASIWEACREPLAQNGLSIAQLPLHTEENAVCLLTRLMHESGEWLQSVTVIPVTKADAQGFGSALTYARRYALAAMVGIAQDDDDGNAAASAAPTERREKPRQTPDGEAQSPKTGGSTDKPYFAVIRRAKALHAEGWRGWMKPGDEEGKLMPADNFWHAVTRAGVERSYSKWTAEQAARVQECVEAVFTEQQQAAAREGDEQPALTDLDDPFADQ